MVRCFVGGELAGWLNSRWDRPGLRLPVRERGYPKIAGA